MAELGSAFVKYGPTKNALLTPREQKYLKTDNDELWIETPFFNEGQVTPLKNQIIHFNKFDRFKIEDVVSDASDSFKAKERKGIWNTSAMDNDFGKIGGRGRRFCFGSKLIHQKIRKNCKGTPIWMSMAVS